MMLKMFMAVATVVRGLALALLLVGAMPAIAAEKAAAATPTAPISSADADIASEARIRQRLGAAFPEIPFDFIARSPYPGLFQVVSGGDVLYVSPDGKYLLVNGAMFAVPEAGQKPVNLTQEFLAQLDQKRAPMRAAEIAKLDKKQMLNYPAAKPQYDIFVFTDIDCGYCRKLHGHMADMNDLGISVHYLAYPRAGPDSESASKLESVWCAADPRKAMTAAKSGQEVPSKTCKNPIKQHYELSRKFGLSGTPAIVLKDGTLLPGYLEPKALLTELKKRKS